MCVSWVVSPIMSALHEIVQVIHSKLSMMLLQAIAVLQLKTRWCSARLLSFPGSVTQVFLSFVA